MDATALFSGIYDQDRWTGGSGPGSTPDFCRPVAGFLAAYIRDNRVRSLVDLGCGDFQWMPGVLAETGVCYVGLDVVPALIDRHRAAWPGRRFDLFDVSAAPAGEIPAADLYWSKDVLQHWPSELVTAFLDLFFAAKPGAHLLVCNCAGQAADDRVLDDRWHFAPLGAGQPPLADFAPELVFAWRGKHVYRLHQRAASTLP
jgi:hypothetical protein